MVRAATWLSLALAGLLGVANAAEVANTEDTPDERAQQLCSANVPCSDGYYCTLLGHCAPKFLSNAVCAYNEQCAGGYCRNIGFYQYCACFSHDQCNNDMPGKKKYVCTPQNYCSPCKKKGCYPEFRLELGELCLGPNDCQSGKCVDDVCSCSPSQPCEGGALCQVDLDCESGYCGDDDSGVKRCKCFNHKKKKVRVGCTDEQLCTGSNTCEPLKLGGESCENSKECVGKCKKGVCQCSKKVPCQDDFYCEGKKCVPQLNAEETCYDDIECKSGNCENYKCGCVADEVVECPSGQYCLENGSEEVTGQGVCSEKKDWWQFCDDNDECDSGKCREVGNKKRCKCRNDADCPNANRFTCDTDEGTCLVKDGKKCIVNDDPAKNLLSDGRNVRCESGACVDGFCGKGLGGATCVGADGTPDNKLCKHNCIEDNSDQNEHVCECKLGKTACADETQYCDSDNQCKQKVLGGEDCKLEGNTVDASVCQSDDCGGNNRCTCDGPGNCKDGMYCPQGGGACQWSKFGGATGCQNMDLAYCKSGLCVDNTCGCTAHSHCTEGFCAEDKTCKDKLVGGEECGSDEQCESGTCSKDGVCGCSSANNVDCKDGQFCDSSVCKDHLFAGEVCELHGQCLSGTCNPDEVCTCAVKEDCQNEDNICRTLEDGICGPPLNYGLSCGSDEECESGQCNENGKCGCQNELDCAGMSPQKTCMATYSNEDLVNGYCVDKESS